MRNLPLVYLLCYSVLFTLSSTAYSAQPRDKIGVVLSGGGAKGSAHIGVLKVLEQHNIPIDYIVGTSIGAYVAGMYALGYSVDDIERIMLDLAWDDGYSDTVPRESLPFTNKQFRDQYNLALRLGFSEGEVKVPHGLLLGQSAYQLLRQSTDTVPVFESFDDLAVPYRAVASDIATAKTVVLNSGSINQAMKASAAVPGIVAAVEMDGKMLVDGGITNNMPIDVVKEMGADIVIAVDIGSSLFDKSQLTSTVAVLNQLSTILTNNTSLAQIKLLTEKDILLRPAIGELSTTDWSIMPIALDLGEKKAREYSHDFSKLGISDADYLAYQENKKIKSKQWFDKLKHEIIEVQFNNESKVDVDIIAKHFALPIGQAVTKEQLDEAIDRVYALDAFERVGVEFIDTEDGRIVVLETNAKSWGPNYLDFGFNLRTNFSNKSIFALNMAYKLTDITENGGQWLNDFQLGWETLLATEFYQPIGKMHDYYAKAKAKYAHDKWERNKSRPELTNEYYQGLLATGVNYTNSGILEAGIFAETGELKIDTASVGKYDYDSIGSYVKLEYDDLNSINFPTQGNKLSVELTWTRDDYSPLLTPIQKDNAFEVKFDWRGAFGIKGHTFVGITSFASVKNDSDFTVHVTELGGFLNLSGYQEDALIGTDKAFAAVVYQYDLGHEVPGGSGLPLYLGTSLEAGNVWGLGEDVSFTDVITSGSFYLGTDTSFGPAVLGFGVASDGENTVFLSLGKNW